MSVNREKNPKRNYIRIFIELLGLIASIIGIFAFITGMENIQSILKAGNIPNVTPTIQTTLISLSSSPTPFLSRIATNTPSNNNTNPQQVCPNALPTRLSIGNKGRILPSEANWLNTAPMRSSIHPNQSKKIILIPVGGVFDILDGPACADGHAWWKVKYRGYIGWTAEGDTVYWIELVN